MTALLTQIQVLQTMVDSMKLQMEAMRTVKEKEEPYMNSKDVDKPTKYNGDKWSTWEGDFRNFLARRDHRWKGILAAIKGKSDKPLTLEAIQELREDTGMIKDNVYEAFRDQLYEYLKTYTAGDVHTNILSNGPTKAFESWRRLCDQGRSIRVRPLRDEKRALYHPKQATADTLIKAIADWEKKLANYVDVVPEGRMEDPEKIMCLEDMCPEPIQRYLSEKAQIHKIDKYEQFKDAIDQYFYEERRWSKTSKPRLNACCGALHSEHGEDGEHGEREEHGEGPSINSLSADDQWTANLLGEINVLVRNKFAGKGKGKGKNGQATTPMLLGKGNATAPMDVDLNGSTAKEERLCFECGKPGHIGRNCPVRQARVAAGGPAILNGDGKGKGGKFGNKGGGKHGKGSWGNAWPNSSQWASMYPGPSMTQWRNWQPRQDAQLGKAALFEAPSQLSAIQALFQGGGAYSIAPKGADARPEKTRPKGKSYESANKFQCLHQGDEERHDEKITVNVEDLIKPVSRNKQRKQRMRERKDMQSRSKSPPYDDQLVKFIRGEIGMTPDVVAENVRLAGTINYFGEVKARDNLCPIGSSGAQSESSAVPATPSGTVDTSKWETLMAIVDSGATIPVLHPNTGKAYPVQESAASRAGVEYECANHETVPNLGEKKMAVMTEEGTLRGYSSQCADVSKSLQSVRAMNTSGHAVCFGLGPNGEDHLIINRMSGEINRMVDDGINYLQRLLVIPPDQIEAVQTVMMMQAGQYDDGQATDFGRPGR